MRRGILASVDELGALRSRIARRPFDRFYERLQERCALIFESAPMTEMNWQTAWASGRWNAACNRDPRALMVRTIPASNPEASSRRSPGIRALTTFC